MSMRQSTNAPLQQFKQSTASSWRYEQITISGSALKTITFLDSTPNMFLIQNSNKATLHIGLSAIPTLEECEFKVNPNSSKPFGRPTPCSELYIRNCSTIDITISLFSYYGTFDMSILTNNDVDISGTELHTQITGIQNPLPSGTNVIGKVALSDSLPSGNNTIGKVALSDSLPTGKNNIGSVGITGEVKVTNDNFAIINTINTVVNSIADKLTDMIASKTLADILTAVENINTNTGDNDHILDYLSMIASNTGMIERAQPCGGTTKVGSNAKSVTVSDSSSNPITIKLLTNDGETDITLTFKDSAKKSTTFVLKSGETITDLVTCDSLVIGAGTKRYIMQGDGETLQFTEEVK